MSFIKQDQAGFNKQQDFFIPQKDFYGIWALTHIWPFWRGFAAIIHPHKHQYSTERVIFKYIIPLFTSLDAQLRKLYLELNQFWHANSVLRDHNYEALFSSDFPQYLS